MTKGSGFRILCLLVALLSRQVSGTVYPQTWVTPTATRGTRNPVGFKEAREFDTMTKKDSACMAPVYAIRGGGIGSMVSDFNEYIGASKSRGWAVLMFSILMDTVSVTLMKAGQKESSIYKVVLSFVGFFLSLAGFGLALGSIDVSIAYAIWASVGTAIVSVVGIVCFGERLDMAKVICLAMILLGVVGLELTDRHC